MIVIVDSGVGNLGSVARAVEECGYTPLITAKEKDFVLATHVILPGVGSFMEGMNQLQQRNLIPILNKTVREEKIPFLGICLGMQLIADSGEEEGNHLGLGWIAGKVTKIPARTYNLPLPHVGWNNIEIMDNPTQNNHTLFTNIKSNSDVYFVHSYYFNAEYPEEDVLATVNYGITIPAVIKKENIFGMQFHPEKSQKVGLNLLKNFLNIR